MWFFKSKREKLLEEKILRLETDYQKIAEQIKDIMMSEIIAHHPELEELMIRDTNARYHLPAVVD